MSRMTTKNSILIALLGASFAFASAQADDDSVELDQVRQKIGEMFEMIEPENVNASQVDGWYAIQQGSIIAYVSAVGHYLLQGDLIDLDQNINNMENQFSEVEPVLN